MKHIPLLFIITTFTSNRNAQWILTEQKGIKEGWSNFNKIETDILGNPYIFYSQNQRLNCKKFTGSTWETLDSKTLYTFRSIILPDISDLLPYSESLKSREFGLIDLIF